MVGPLLHRPTSTRRPLSSATAALRGSAPGRGRRGEELLAELLDFEGAVQLARALEAGPPAALVASPPGGGVAHACRRLAEAEREARQPLLDLHTGASLISGARLLRALVGAGAPASRQRKALALAAQELFAPLEARTLQRIASVRRRVLDVREELGPVVAAGGPIAARLEKIDAALARATAARSHALFVRAVGTLGDAFAVDLERSVLALPKGCLALPVEAWTCAGGFVPEHVGRCESLVVATFLHERARVEMLVQNTLGERLR